MALHPTRQLWANPAQLHVTGEKAAQPLVDSGWRDTRGKMVSPHFCRRILGGEIGKSHQRAAAVWRRKMQSIVERGRGKADHLRELSGSNERSVGFGNHKYTVKGEAADVCQGVREPNSTHRFNRMNKKSGQRYHCTAPRAKISLQLYDIQPILAIMRSNFIGVKVTL